MLCKRRHSSHHSRSRPLRFSGTIVDEHRDEHVPAIEWLRRSSSRILDLEDLDQYIRLSVPVMQLFGRHLRPEPRRLRLVDHAVGRQRHAVMLARRLRPTPARAPRRRRPSRPGACAGRRSRRRRAWRRSGARRPGCVECALGGRVLADCESRPGRSCRSCRRRGRAAGRRRGRSWSRSRTACPRRSRSPSPGPGRRGYSPAPPESWRYSLLQTSTGALVSVISTGTLRTPLGKAVALRPSSLGRAPVPPEWKPVTL